MDYRLIETEDGTPSLFSYEYNEAMHSLSGAYEEALLKHIYPSGILNLKNKTVKVLDIGFGLGFNVLALLSEYLDKYEDRFIEIFSLEKDFEFLPLMENIRFGDKRDEIYRRIVKSAKLGKYCDERYKIQLLKGDARETIKNISPAGIDAVFHDPFSPSKNPELWTLDFFRLLKSTVTDKCIITTYSSAIHVRAAFIEAGFKIGKGPSVGRKREGTLATLSGRIKLFSCGEIELLKGNPRAVPYRDYSLNDPKDLILKRWEEDIKAV